MRITDFSQQALLGAREHLETSVARINDALNQLELGVPLEAGKSTARAIVEARVGVERLKSISDKLVE
jgi:hypothetical protein